MSKKKIKIIPPTAQQQMANALTLIQTRFTRLKEIRVEMNKLKALYQEHDAIVEELLPLFIQVHLDKFVVAREISLNNQTYRLEPYFYNTQKSKLVSKVWKSTAFEMGSIE